ncbi:B-cell receptor CD22-like [Dendropsophus ebraccatus]|uniref:B-cell receptor CD22-like n=1 Tax=Dendropsophus ebraccatus TaxID=150705 RepID=UPI0038319DBB
MLEGDTTSMLCTAYHKCGSSPPSLQWNIPGNVTHQSEKISRGSWKEKSKLTYIPSYVDNGSPVQCTASYPNGLIIERNKTMNVYYDPKHANVTIIGMDEVIEGSDVTLQCNSFANPAVYFYEWYIGKNKSRLRWESGREITVRKVTRDMEPYSCTARNSMGSRESALTHIPVLFAPENVSVTVIEMEEVMEGSDVTLQCNSFFKPEVNEYEWYKGKEKSRLPETGREITVRNVTRDMEPYSCTAINPVGRGESALTQIPVLYEVSGISNIIFLVMIGVIGLLLLVVLLVYYCQRLKHFQMPHITT